MNWISPFAQNVRSQKPLASFWWLLRFMKGTCWSSSRNSSFSVEGENVRPIVIRDNNGASEESFSHLLPNTFLVSMPFKSLWMLNSTKSRRIEVEGIKKVHVKATLKEDKSALNITRNIFILFLLRWSNVLRH